MEKGSHSDIFFIDKEHWYFKEENYDNEATPLPRASLKAEYSDEADKFWKLLKEEKLDKGDYDFDYFIFPCEYGNGFADYIEGGVIDKPVSFFNSIFIGATALEDLTFEQSVDFRYTNFRNDAYVIDCRFNGPVSFYSTIFSEITFKGLEFNEDVSFNFSTLKSPLFTNIRFMGSLYMESCVFTSYNTFDTLYYDKTVKFNWCHFFGTVAFQKIEQNDHVFFNGSEFKGNLFYDEPVIRKDKTLEFRATRFSRERPTEFSKHTKGGQIVFYESNLTPEVLFHEMDMTRVEFYVTEIRDVHLGMCSFGKNPLSGRIQIPHESYRQNLRFQKKREFRHLDISYIWKRKDNYYKHLLEFYRSLKVNLMNAKEWTDAGDAYKSEMIIRKRLLLLDYFKTPWKVNYLITLLAMNLHYAFSGFNQSIVLPLLWLFAFWIGFAGYFFALGFIPDVRTALSESFYALMPLSGGLEGIPEMKNALVIERIIGALLISLFALSTRSRFRQ